MTDLTDEFTNFARKEIHKEIQFLNSNSKEHEFYLVVNAGFLNLYLRDKSNDRRTLLLRAHGYVELFKKFSDLRVLIATTLNIGQLETMKKLFGIK